MGWFSKIFGSVSKFIGIAVAAVATIVTAGLAAPIGSAILGAVGAESLAASTVIAGTTAAELTGGAVLGSGINAIEAAATGGNVAKAALTGGVGGLVGTAVGGLVGNELASPVGETVGPMQPNIAGSTSAGAAAVKGLGNFAGSTAGALTGGANLSSALRTGAISGASGGLSAGLSSALNLSDYGLPGKVASGLLGPAISYGLGKAFPASSKGGTQSTSAQPTVATSSPYAGGASQSFQLAGAPSALGSALFAAPGIGYSPGGPVLGGAGGEDKAPKNVWSDTDKSLRDVGSTVT